MTKNWLRNRKWRSGSTRSVELIMKMMMIILIIIGAEFKLWNSFLQTPDTSYLGQNIPFSTSFS